MKSIKKRFTLFVAVAAIVCVSVFASVSTGRAYAETDAESVLEMCERYLERNAFSTELRGTIKARAFGIPYKQTVSGGRNVNGNEFTCVDESRSALVNAGYKRSGGADGYYVSTAKYKKKQFVYGAPDKFEYDAFVAAYGLPPISLCKFVTSGTVKAAERVDENTYRYILEPQKSTEFCVSQVKTVLDCSSVEYRSVELVVETDGMRPICVKTFENFRAEKYGGINCTAEYTETFIYNS